MVNLDPKKLGRVAVLMGGVTERSVSLESGRGVLNALLELGVDAFALEIYDDCISPLIAAKPDRVFNILHGGFGEGGGITAICQNLQIPVTGANYAASALALDKYRCKLIWQAAGLATTPGRLITAQDDPDTLVKEFGLPIVIKANRGGSTLGTTIVKQVDEIASAIHYAQEYDQEILVERYISNGEYTVFILGETVFPAISIQAKDQFYDFAAKYESDETIFVCPADLSSEQHAQINSTAMAAFKLIGASQWGRVDFMHDHQGQFLLMELNTTPGLTSHSLAVKAAKAKGINYNALVAQILSESIL